MAKQTHGPLTIAPNPPAYLPADAAEVWRRVAHYLLDRKLLHSGDVDTITAFARASARLRHLEDVLDAEGLFLENGRPHPGITAANTTAATVGKLAQNLGLAPVARSRLTVQTQKGETRDNDAGDWADVLPMRGKKR